MKSRAGYFLAAIPLLAGFCVMGWLVWGALGDIESALTRIVVPGTSLLTLKTPGAYTIFHESESVVDGKLYSAQTIPGLRITVAAEDGTPIPVIAPAISSSYTIGSHSGKSLLTFDITQPGSYRLTAAYAGGQAEPQTVLAIGQNFVGPLIKTVFAAVGAAFAGFGGALALVLTTYFWRRRIRERTSAPTWSGAR
jgi:hypothetical protein